jgi:(2Fe-2S) ferredoxin
MTLPHHQILVCLNERPPESPKGSCKPKGSEELYKRIREVVHLRGMKREVAVNSTSCLKCCPFGPTVSVWPEGIYYGQMTPDRVEALLDSIASGKPIDDWKVPAEEVGNY